MNIIGSFGFFLLSMSICLQATANVYAPNESEHGNLFINYPLKDGLVISLFETVRKYIDCEKIRRIS